MSGIYIPGMEMPKSRPLIIKINPDGSINSTFENGYRKYKAVPVPDHGRLGDLDEIESGLRGKIDRLRKSYFDEHDPYDGAKGDGLFESLRMVSNASTIIPADKE